jgi:hypothetical protein
MNAFSARRRFLFGTGVLMLTLVLAPGATPVVSQGCSTQPNLEYRVLEVPPDRRSIQAGGELVAFEMGELQTPRLSFNQEAPPAP